MIIGYSVLYEDNETTLKDVLWNRRIVYSDWYTAIKKSEEQAKEAQQFFWSDSFIVSVIKAESQKECHTYGRTAAFLIKDKTSENNNIGTVWIIPVYDE